MSYQYGTSMTEATPTLDTDVIWTAAQHGTTRVSLRERLRRLLSCSLGTILRHRVDLSARCQDLLLDARTPRRVSGDCERRGRVFQTLTQDKQPLQTVFKAYVVGVVQRYVGAHLIRVRDLWLTFCVARATAPRTIYEDTPYTPGSRYMLIAIYFAFLS